jgi:hypothetical protein
MVGHPFSKGPVDGKRKIELLRRGLDRARRRRAICCCGDDAFSHGRQTAEDGCRLALPGGAVEHIPPAAQPATAFKQPARRTPARHLIQALTVSFLDGIDVLATISIGPDRPGGE